jgi:hypothetical protein
VLILLILWKEVYTLILFVLLLLLLLLLLLHCAGGKIEKNEMGGTRGAYGGGERCAQGSGGET